jgi:hypothetical protein
MESGSVVLVLAGVGSPDRRAQPLTAERIVQTWPVSAVFAQFRRGLHEKFGVCGLSAPAVTAAAATAGTSPRRAFRTALPVRLVSPGPHISGLDRDERGEPAHRSRAAADMLDVVR